MKNFVFFANEGALLFCYVIVVETLINTEIFGLKMDVWLMCIYEISTRKNNCQKIAKKSVKKI